MRDYEAIKKALTFYAATAETTRKTKTLLDAADAIEELLAEVEHWKLEAAANETDRKYLIDENRKLVNSLMNFRVPTWVSVEDELPEQTVETNLFDQEEIHANCTVQILKNSVTGDVSVGWWPNDNKPIGTKEGN